MSSSFRSLRTDHAICNWGALLFGRQLEPVPHCNSQENFCGMVSTFGCLRVWRSCVSLVTSSLVRLTCGLLMLKGRDAQGKDSHMSGMDSAGLWLTETMRDEFQISQLLCVGACTLGATIPGSSEQHFPQFSLCRRHMPIRFLPFVPEACGGGWAPVAMRTWTTLAQLLATRTGDAAGAVISAPWHSTKACTVDAETRFLNIPLTVFVIVGSDLLEDCSPRSPRRSLPSTSSL